MSIEFPGNGCWVGSGVSRAGVRMIGRATVPLAVEFVHAEVVSADGKGVAEADGSVSIPGCGQGADAGTGADTGRGAGAYKFAAAGVYGMTESDLGDAIDEFLEDYDRAMNEYDQGYVDADATLSVVDTHVKALRETASASEDPE